MLTLAAKCAKPPRLYRHRGVVGDGGDFCSVRGARSGRYRAYLSDERQRNEQKEPRPAGLGARILVGRLSMKASTRFQRRPSLYVDTAWIPLHLPGAFRPGRG